MTEGLGLDCSQLNSKIMLRSRIGDDGGLKLQFISGKVARRWISSGSEEGVSRPKEESTISSTWTHPRGIRPFRSCSTASSYLRRLLLQIPITGFLPSLPTAIPCLLNFNIRGTAPPATPAEQSHHPSSAHPSQYYPSPPSPHSHPPL